MKKKNYNMYWRKKKKNKNKTKIQKRNEKNL